MSVIPWVITGWVAVFALVRELRVRKREALTSAATLAAASIVRRTDEQADFQKRRADEFFGIIEGILGERDQWKTMYYKMSQQAGVAQAWLLRELSTSVLRSNRYAEVLREKGVNVQKVAIDPALKTIVEEFGGRHPSAGDSVIASPTLDDANRARDRFALEEKQMAEASKGTAEPILPG